MIAVFAHGIPHNSQWDYRFYKVSKPKPESVRIIDITAHARFGEIALVRVGV